MAKHFAKIIALAAGGVAAWQVWIQFDDVFPDPAWLKWAGAAVVVVVVYPILYFPFLRPISDVIGDRMSATRHRFTSTRSGVGLDEIPLSPKAGGIVACSYCGKPGAPICESCRERLRK